MDTYWLEGRDTETGAARHCLRLPPHRRQCALHADPHAAVPVRVPRRVYRNETTDASHERAFFQYEALIVDKKLPFTAGRLLVKTILQAVFGRDVKIRMRAGFFRSSSPASRSTCSVWSVKAKALGVQARGLARGDARRSPSS